jgi:hypothetical protein
MGTYKNQKWKQEYIDFLFTLTDIKRKKERHEIFKKKFPETNFTENAISNKMCEIGACHKSKRLYDGKPLYSEQIKKGYVRIKVAYPNVWVQKQKWVYLETHPWEVNEIGDTDVFIFLDGDNRNFAPSNIARLERKYQCTFLGCGGVVKGNAELTKINLARAKLKSAELDVGEKLGLCKKYECNTGRVYRVAVNEYYRKYRAKKKENL